MHTIEQINHDPVYQQVMADSFGGVLYNVANQDKYDASDIIEMWYGLSASEREAAGGIMKGAFSFLKGEK